MTVVSIALTEMLYFFVTVIALICAYLTDTHIAFGYIQACLQIFLLNIVVVRVPLLLNWSSNMYSSVFTRVVVYQIIAIATYGLVYYRDQCFGSNFKTYWDALYFSATTWTTLGYGDISPEGATRLLTSIQALNGLFTIPVFASVIWLYCEKRLRDKPETEGLSDKLTLISDEAIGVMRQHNSNRLAIEEPIRSQINLVDCKQCSEPTPKLVKYYDIMGKTFPLANFIVHCKVCGKLSKPKKNAYLAAWSWNSLNRNK